MADKDPSQLTSAASAADTDLVVIYPTGGPLKKLTFAAFVTQIAAAIAGTYLTVANSLSDVASASAARANLGLGTAATLASTALFQVANNLSEVANAATARANIGAAAASAAVLTGGMTLTGSTKQNVQAVASTSIDVSLSDGFTKSISANTTFTFDNATAAKLQAFVLLLTITSSAVPTWPATVDWAGGTTPTLGDGEHVLGFLTFDGGTTWKGFVGGLAFA